MLYISYFVTPPTTQHNINTVVGLDMKMTVHCAHHPPDLEIILSYWESDPFTENLLISAVRKCSKLAKKWPKLTQRWPKLTPKYWKSGKLTQNIQKVCKLLQNSYSRQKPWDFPLKTYCWSPNLLRISFPASNTISTFDKKHVWEYKTWHKMVIEQVTFYSSITSAIEGGGGSSCVLTALT